MELYTSVQFHNLPLQKSKGQVHAVNMARRVGVKAQEPKHKPKNFGFDLHVHWEPRCEVLNFKCIKLCSGRACQPQQRVKSISILYPIYYARARLFLAAHEVAAASARLLEASKPLACKQKHSGFWVKLHRYMHCARSCFDMPSRHGAQLQLHTVLLLQYEQVPR